MKVGFKAGPRNWPVLKQIVAADHPELCELWFDILRADEYQEVIAWLTQHNVAIGLHHWGVCRDSIKTNLATNVADIRHETIRQVKATIDIGARINCAYVNIHPGAAFLEQIDFTLARQSLMPGTQTPATAALHLLQTAAHELHNYATQRGVTLTIETLPGAENEYYEARQGRYLPHNTSLETIITLAEQGSWIANDITHTAAAVALATDAPDDIFQGVYTFSERVRGPTRLLHINTMVPPFDGTDSHHGILPADWEAHAIPSREQVIQLLALFKDRADVAVIPEPRQAMHENFLALRELVTLGSH